MGGNIAKAVQSKLVSRSEMFITTKVPCCPSAYYSYGAKKCADKGVDLGSTEEEFKGTLEKVGVDQVDLLLMHWPCTKFEDTVAVYKVMESFVAKGKARVIGVSNFN